MTAAPREKPTANNNKEEQILEGPIKGHFGTWNFTTQDAKGIDIYRTSLLIGALSAFFPILSLTLLPLKQIPPQLLDFAYITWFISMTISLNKIHIYVKPLHQALKLLLYAGFLATISAHFLLPAEPPTSAFTGGIISHILLSQRPLLVLAFCPQMAATTGLFFKEAFCFQRLEAVALTLLVPYLSVRGLIGWGKADSIMTVVGGLLYVVFAGRKLIQNKRDDLGDKSVFDYLEEKAAEGA